MNEFKIGDKVVKYYNTTPMCIGTIINITPKKGNIAVDYESHIQRYDSNGALLHNPQCYILPLTPELELKLQEKYLIERIERLLNDKKDTLTKKQMEKLIDMLEILDDDHNTEIGDYDLDK